MKEEFKKKICNFYCYYICTDKNMNDKTIKPQFECVYFNLIKDNYPTNNYSDLNINLRVKLTVFTFLLVISFANISIN